MQMSYVHSETKFFTAFCRHCGPIPRRQKLVDFVEKSVVVCKIEVFVGLGFFKAVFRRVLRDSMFKGQYLRNAAGWGRKIFHEGKMSYREL